jgi:protein TonB
MRVDGSRFFAVSVAAHVLLGGALASIPPKIRHESVAISFRDVTKPKPPAKIEPPPEREPPPAPTHAARAKAAPAKTPKPALVEPSRAEATSSMDTLPDFGLSLSGGGAGMAVPGGGGGGGAASNAPVAAKTLSRAVAPKRDECADPPAKPRPLSRPTPAYTEEARAAGISGKVRVEISVDEHGRVVSVRVLQGLGHGLDEAALAAARAMAFEPAMRCGRASPATFKIGFTFAP